MGPMPEVSYLPTVYRFAFPSHRMTLERLESSDEIGNLDVGDTQNDIDELWEIRRAYPEWVVTGPTVNGPGVWLAVRETEDSIDVMGRGTCRRLIADLRVRLDSEAEQREEAETEKAEGSAIED